MLYLMAIIIIAFILSNKKPRQLTDDELFSQKWKDDNVPEEFHDL